MCTGHKTRRLHNLILSSHDKNLAETLLTDIKVNTYDRQCAPEISWHKISMALTKQKACSMCCASACVWASMTQHLVQELLNHMFMQCACCYLYCSYLLLPWYSMFSHSHCLGWFRKCSSVWRKMVIKEQQYPTVHSYWLLTRLFDLQFGSDWIISR